MATTSEHIDNNVNKKDEEEEAKKLQSSSTNDEQGNKTTEKIDDLNQIGKTDTLSSVQSTNEDKKSDQTFLTSDTNTEKKNEEQNVETTSTATTQKKEESESTPVSSTSTTDNNIKIEETTTTITSSNSNNDQDIKKDESAISSAVSNDTKQEESTTVISDDQNKNQESTSPLATSNPNQDDNNAFPIEKGDEQHLTDFQRQKAKYFFNVNLDIENKKYVTWEDVEFYLLFHVTAAGKEGSDGGDLEARLSRAARAFWEHVHNQIPLPDGKRETLTLDQFLDTWASLIDYVVQTNQLPPIIQDLVKLGFELYSTDNGDDQSATIQPQAFDQLFQKMNLGRPFAIMAYKYLTDNGKKSLDTDKIDSIVKAVITSSDDEHNSHFLLPGFFKTISDNKNNENDNKNQSPSPVQDGEQTKIDDKSSQEPNISSPPPPPSTSTPTPSQPQPSNASLSPSPQEQQKSNEPPPSSSQSQQQNGPSSPILQGQKPANPTESQNQSGFNSQNGVLTSPPPTPSSNQQQNLPPPPKPQKAVIQREDEGIRLLLRYYHIDDSDIVEVAGGSVQRLVLIHPERPLPPYILQNKQLLQKLQSDWTNASSVQENGFNNPPNQLNNNGQASQEATATSAETKPKITLEERVSRGEAQIGPTVPLRHEQKQENSSSIGVHQVYPQLNKAQQEEQQKQAKLQATQPPINDEKQPKKEISAANDVSSSSKQDETKQTKGITHDDEEKIIATVLKQLAPIVEKRVAAELRRIQSGETDQDEDDNIIQFPFMLGGGFPFFGAPHGGPPPQVSREQQQQSSQQYAPGQGQQQVNQAREPDFGGLPVGGAAFIPPELLMAMMNDLTRGGIGGGIPGFPPNMPPPPHGPAGVGGFMMFVDDNQFMGGPPGYPPRPGPGF